MGKKIWNFSGIFLTYFFPLQFMAILLEKKEKKKKKKKKKKKRRNDKKVMKEKKGQTLNY